MRCWSARSLPTMTVWFDEQQDHGVVGGRRCRRGRRDGGHGRYLLLLRPRDHHVMGQRRVGVQERTGQSALRGLEVLLHGVRPVRQQRDCAVGGGPHGFRAGRPELANRVRPATSESPRPTPAAAPARAAPRRRSPSTSGCDARLLFAPGRHASPHPLGVGRLLGAAGRRPPHGTNSTLETLA